MRNQPTVECKAGYFRPVIKWSQAPCLKDRPQCNNTPVECPDCNVIVWKYGMLEHWQQMHQGQLVPSYSNWEKGEKEEKKMECVVKAL